MDSPIVDLAQGRQGLASGGLDLWPFCSQPNLGAVLGPLPCYAGVPVSVPGISPEPNNHHTTEFMAESGTLDRLCL